MEFHRTAPGSRVRGASRARPRPGLDGAPRYNIPSIFSPSNIHQIKRLGSPWACLAGAVPFASTAVVGEVSVDTKEPRRQRARENEDRRRRYSTGRTKALTPEGQNFITSHPLMRRFDGQQLGPGSYNVPMSMSGRLRTTTAAARGLS